MNQFIKILLLGLVGLSCIFGLASGMSCSKPQEIICVPLGSLLYEPGQSEGATDCSKQGYYIIPTDLSLFYQCYDNMRYDFKCQDGLFFDLSTKRCEWPKNLECNPLEAVCPNGSILVLPSQPNNCSESDRSYHADPSDPSHFFQCWDGERYDYVCQLGLLFDLSNERCEWASKMQCYNYTPISY